MQHIVLISKDILSTRYLPRYGSRYWKAPNIDELVARGTVFHRHYTATPSTAMAFTGMFTGKYPYETGRAGYGDNIDLIDRFMGDVTVLQRLTEQLSVPEEKVSCRGVPLKNRAAYAMRKKLPGIFRRPKRADDSAVNR